MTFCNNTFQYACIMIKHYCYNEICIMTTIVCLVKFAYIDTVDTSK